MAKRTEITIETSRLLVISRLKRMIALCASCNKDVDWIAIDEAARLSGASSRDVFRRVENGDLHSMETSEGILVVCLDSLVPEGSDENRQIKGPRKLDRKRI